MPNLLRYDASQGTTSEITFPTWVGAGNGNWSVIVSFVCTSFASTPRILGQLSSTTNRALVIGTTGFLSWVSVGIAGAAGSIQLNTRYWAKLESVGTTKNLYQSTDGVNYTLVGTTTYSAANMDWSKLGSASNVRSQVFDFYSIEFSGSTYTDSFDGTTAPSTGTSWPSVGGTRNLTLTNFAGTTDSWWVPYGATYTNISSSAPSQSDVGSYLYTSINFDSESASDSSVYSSLLAGAIQIGSFSQSDSFVTSDIYTEILFSSLNESRSEVTSQIEFSLPSGLNSVSESDSRAQSYLFTEITFASFADSDSFVNSNFQEPVVARYLVRYNGLEFIGHPLERYDGVEFKRHPLMRKTETGWVQYNG